MIPRSGWLTLCVLVIAVEWLVIASNYKDSVFLGTYHLEQGGESASLILRTDQTFQQDVIRDGVRQSCRGTWRRIGEGGLAFSKEFLPLSGQEPGADGTSYGNLEKSFGLFPSIALIQSHVLWYGRTIPAENSTVDGTYVENEEGVPATLLMRSDHVFEQTVKHAGETRHAHGTWGFRQNGDVLFSRDFLKTSGEPLTRNEMASASHPKGSNLQIEVAVNPSFTQPVFKKKLLSY